MALVMIGISGDDVGRSGDRAEVDGVIAARPVALQAMRDAVDYGDVGRQVARQAYQVDIDRLGVGRHSTLGMAANAMHVHTIRLVQHAP